MAALACSARVASRPRSTASDWAARPDVALGAIEVTGAGTAIARSLRGGAAQAGNGRDDHHSGKADPRNGMLGEPAHAPRLPYAVTKMKSNAESGALVRPQSLSGAALRGPQIATSSNISVTSAAIGERSERCSVTWAKSGWPLSFSTTATTPSCRPTRRLSRWATSWVSTTRES